ncbi:P-loop containing nucleoside triphosphate hydrolase protein [Xylariomycetidae sp. FL0641]|nr:P-loop containing nucleoside triphosphate hydrolase protein [Xylariomycetidae sp. FL0641]
MEEVTVKVLLLGDAKVGKTTFLSRISGGASALEGRAPITLLRDIDQPFIFELRNRKRAYRIEFYDTASPENWRLLTPDLVVLCYDISQRATLVNLQRVWINEVHANFRSDRLPVIVLGLKRDLRSESDPNGTVYPQEAYRIAQEIRVDRYIECSAITGALLKLAFEELCKAVAKTVSDEGGQSEGGCVIL